MDNMHTLVILVHGFNVTDGGEGSIKKLIPYFVERGAAVKAFEYGFKFFLGTRFFNEEIAEALANEVNQSYEAGFKRVIVIGHSNGSTIAHLASKDISHPVEYVYINPALERDLAPCECVQSVKVWHNEKDKAVLWSKLLFLFASERPWGVMGNKGYEGDDERFTNYDTMKDFPIQAKGHSAVFDNKNIGFYGPTIARISLE